jgi:hypothetical protein
VAATMMSSLKTSPHRIERLVGSDGNGIFILSLDEDLEEEFGAAFVQFHVAELVDLCGYPHRLTYAEPATMPMLSVLPVNAGRWRLATSKTLTPPYRHSFSGRSLFMGAIVLP